MGASCILSQALINSGFVGADRDFAVKDKGRRQVGSMNAPQVTPSR